jgi:hypothetical protein
MLMVTRGWALLERTTELRRQRLKQNSEAEVSGEGANADMEYDCAGTCLPSNHTAKLSDSTCFSLRMHPSLTFKCYTLELRVESSSAGATTIAKP